MYEGREIYAHAPLQLVVAEIRYPFAPRLRQANTLDKIQIALEKVLPIRRPEQHMSVEVGPSGLSGQTSVDVFRLIDRTQTRSLVITPEIATIETTSYREFEEFLNLIEQVLKVLASDDSIPAAERIGLRYLDEVRVPADINDARDWKDWVSPNLIAITESDALPVRTFQSAIVTDLGNNMGLQFRCGATFGPGLIAEGVLRRRTTSEPGQFFVIDIDSFWQANSPDEIIDFDVSRIAEIFRSLHAPTGAKFQSALTDRTRALFRGEQV